MGRSSSCRSALERYLKSAADTLAWCSSILAQYQALQLWQSLSFVLCTEILRVFARSVLASTLMNYAAMFGCQLADGSLLTLALAAHLHTTLCSLSHSLWLVNRLCCLLLGACLPISLTAYLLGCLNPLIRLCLRFSPIFATILRLCRRNFLGIRGLRGKFRLFPRGDRNGLLTFSGRLLDCFHIVALFGLRCIFWLRFFFRWDWSFRNLNLNLALISSYCYLRKYFESRWSFSCGCLGASFGFDLSGGLGNFYTLCNLSVFLLQFSSRLFIAFLNFKFSWGLIDHFWRAFYVFLRLLLWFGFGRSYSYRLRLGQDRLFFR